MPVKKRPQLLAWSHSRRKTYQRCPLLCKYKDIDRLKEPVSQPMLRGTKIHKDAEDYSTGVTRKRPASLDRFAEEFADLRRTKKLLEAEVMIAMTKKWEPTDWFARNTWLRVKIDAIRPLDRGKCMQLIDYKTGKIRPEDMEQLKLYAAVGAVVHPKAEKFQCDLWYLDQGEIVTELYTRVEALAFQPYFEGAVAKMMADRTFKPTPGRHCSWCHFSKDKEGLCQY